MAEDQETAIDNPPLCPPDPDDHFGRTPPLYEEGEGHNPPLSLSLSRQSSKLKPILESKRTSNKSGGFAGSPLAFLFSEILLYTYVSLYITNGRMCLLAVSLDKRNQQITYVRGNIMMCRTNLKAPHRLK